MKKVLLIILTFWAFNVAAISFKAAIKELEKHESIDSLMAISKANYAEAGARGTWGDPNFQIAAKNFPKDDLKDDQSPMTGIEFGVSQKISLTTKYGNIEDAFKSMAKSYEYNAKDKKEALIKSFWEILIIKRKILEELKILGENNAWIVKILKVSKKLYANGKISQQALLDIQIRKTEIETLVSNKKFELSQIKDKLSFLIGSSEIDSRTIPWNLINKNNKIISDFRELSLKEKLKAKEFNLTASKQNYVPDLTFSFGVTKRSDVDGNGDFLGARVSFPLPFSSESYSMHGKAVHEKYAAKKNFEHFKRTKKRNTSILEKEISKHKSELYILKEKTIRFARNSRSITSKSYGLGSSSYVELLQSELKLQKILMHKALLESKRDIKKVTLKYILGETLNE
jgi:outer membrane protein TolC